MATTITYGTLNLNDGTTWTLMEGFDPGERQKTYDEVRTYDGEVGQLNVSEAYLIRMFVPLEVAGASIAAVRTAIAALNTLIDAGAQDLVYNDGSGAVTYSCAHSQRVWVPHDLRWLVGFRVPITFQPVRYP
jgi:hypothetical protein